jgi:hypothetical protein
MRPPMTRSGTGGLPAGPKGAALHVSLIVRHRRSAAKGRSDARQVVPAVP